MSTEAPPDIAGNEKIHRQKRFRFRATVPAGQPEPPLGHYDGRTDKVAVAMRRDIGVVQTITAQIARGTYAHPWEEKRQEVRDAAQRLIAEVPWLDPETLNERFVALIHGINQASNHTLPCEDSAIGHMLELHRYLREERQKSCNNIKI